MIREKILSTMTEILDIEHAQSINDAINDTSILLETGLNSLGFATLVARLEEELGYDPFTLMTEPVYPVTFGEFVHMYEQFKDHAI